MKIKTLVKWLIKNAHPEDEWDASLAVVERHLYCSKHQTHSVNAWDKVVEVKPKVKPKAKRKT